MLVTEDGQMISAISGGCLEADVVVRSHRLLADGGKPYVVRYDTTSSDDLVFGFGMGCSGIVNVLLEPLVDGAAVTQLACIQEFLEAQKTTFIPAEQSLLCIATIFSAEGVPDVSVGDRLITKPDGTVINHISNPEISHQIEIACKTPSKSSGTQSYPLALGKVDVFLEAIRPPQPLLVFGAGYDAIPLAQLAKQLGWHVTVLDHRHELLTHERFTLADRLLSCDPTLAQAYRYLLTPQTVAVVMTHRYSSDLAFLKTLIPAQLRYLGVLGPKRRMQQLRQDLSEQGISPAPEQIQMLYNPAGLDIGAETPEEIALAIVAEIQAVLRGRPGRFLRNRTGSIHTPSPTPCLELAS